ncbi:hypothetical protein [Halobellus sp. GM3]|uniref:hypothetical protein n=1 Tax=Halobellus sp. GM3 TaxID=3458410 RepID=UPI00403D8FED
MAAGGFLLVVVLLAVVAPLLLYALVRAEHDGRETMDRQSAERAARRDTQETRASHGDRRNPDDTQSDDPRAR